MSILKSIILAAILGAAIVSSDFTSVGAEEVLLSAEESEKSGAMIRKESIRFSLLQFLEKLGDTYNVFFTVEEAWQTGESTNQLSSRPVHVSPERTNLQQDLAELQEMIANFDYSVNESNPQIVHIIDERLKNVSNYGVDETIEAIEFNGNVVDLIQDINKKGISISFQNVFLISELKHMDFTTMVSVEGINIKTRDVLSLFISLDRTTRVIWRATTRLDKKENSSVSFYGKGKKR